MSESDARSVPLHWRNQFWQSLEEGAGTRCSECDALRHRCRSCCPRTESPRQCMWQQQQQQQQQSNGAAAVAAAVEPGKRRKDRKQTPDVKLCRHGAKDPLLTSRTGLTSLFLSSATIVFFVPLVILPLAVLISFPSPSPLFFFFFCPRAPGSSPCLWPLSAACQIKDGGPVLIVDNWQRGWVI